MTRPVPEEYTDARNMNGRDPRGRAADERCKEKVNRPVRTNPGIAAEHKHAEPIPANRKIEQENRRIERTNYKIER